MNTSIKRNYRSTLWSNDYQTFNELEREIWDNADPQTEKILCSVEDCREYFVVVRFQESTPVPPQYEDHPPPSPPSLLARAWMSAREWILPLLGIMGMLTLFFAGLFLLILVVRFVVG